jgi:hypothetical protein
MTITCQAPASNPAASGVPSSAHLNCVSRTGSAWDREAVSSGVDRPEEQFARTVVGNVTGAVVVRTDHRHASARTVDARLQYPDGRTGALEISTLGLAAEFAAGKRIAAIDGRLPMPGRWKWIVRASDPWELTRIRALYAKAVLICEAHNVTSVDDLPPAVVGGDADLTWLSTKSPSRLSGIRLPDGAQDQSDFIDLIYQPAETERHSGPDQIVSEVNAALAKETLAKRVAKLTQAEGDQRHLFLRVAESGLEEYSYARLTMCAIAPQHVAPLQGEPDLPGTVSHLWLHAGFGQHVTRWTRDQGWDHPSFA